MNKADSLETSATSQNKPRRRRSRRRNRNGGANSTSQATHSTTKSDKNSKSSKNSGSQQSNAKGHKAKNSGAKGSGSKNQRRRNNATRKVHRKPAPARAAQGNRGGMRTSIETSAGGLVVSGLAEAVQPDGSVDLSRIYVALIGRLDRRGRLLWSMPKGHVEAGEAHDITAEREVWEETGIHGKVLTELGVIDYWFVSEGTRIHKTVHHFLLRFVDGDLNDEDPEVTEVSWVPASTLVEKLAYADERKLARRAHKLLSELAKAEKHAGRATPRS